MIYNINISNSNRDNVINYILKNKENNPNYKVIDFGGSHGGWSTPYVDAIVDFNNIRVNPTNIVFFKMDMTNPNEYNELLTYVEKNGKFDFCIFTHTLEDIINPVFVC